MQRGGGVGMHTSAPGGVGAAEAMPDTQSAGCHAECARVRMEAKSNLKPSM
jgi:hypothetical protein